MQSSTVKVLASIDESRYLQARVVDEEEEDGLISLSASGSLSVSASEQRGRDGGSGSNVACLARATEVDRPESVLEEIFA